MNDKPDTSAFTRPNSYVGRTLSRAGAKRAVAGRGRYTDDVSLPRMLHAAFVRSPFAHARIVSIDTSEASRQPGVALVMTGAELAKLCTAPWVGTLTCFPGMKSAPQFPMAVDRACWVGEPVAMVVAGTRAEAEDAAERVRIEWQELPVVADKKTALAAGSPVIHAELGDNLAFRKVIDTGSVDAAFAKADLVIEDTFEFGRHTAVSLESRAVLAQYDKGTGKLTITTSSQCPHMIQRVFAQTLGVPDHRVQIIAPDVGGSFGLKIHTYGDEVATAAAAIQLGRPVKFIADRLESFVSDIHARENFVKARIAVAKSGEIQAFDIDVLSGAGAYSQYPRTSVLEGTQVLNVTGGPYRHKHYRGRASVVYLNKPPSSQYRAVGHPIGNTVGEHLVDRAATALGIDAIEMRRRNVFPDDGYPATTASGVKLKDLSHQRCIDTLVERMRYFELRAEQARLRKQGIHRGIGIACFIKGTAPGPHGYYGMGGAPISLQDACVIRLEPNGGVICSVGVTEQGQGTDTVMGQIAAAALGVPFESVRVISGDTDAIPYGGGTFGSRAVAIGGEAVYQAARDLRQEILQIAGVLLQADVSALDIVDGTVVDRAGGAKRLPLAEIGRIGHFQLAELPRGMQPVLSHTRRFHLADDLYIFTNGIHGAYVELDVDTGFVRLLKHWVVEDCGRVINPQLADEQVRGGCVQGLGGALYEHCIYDEAGQLQNGTMADYLTPMAAEMPDIDVAHVQTPTSVSELGAKGVGESGTGAAPAVVMNAINDALLPFRARVTTQPITPEVVLTALGKI
ncbi:MAG: xanthine dehydrogenase family protein molybdopterin-binding subunit [Alphaproteobacteria bacterium]|nr:MAG: xanthine dehydrogenase family protein molybdopterin-binding subunit [Alphaproteobacteria bacterium]